jgi:diguanylate cyclase (GGDEF)-like protein/PAS domain S-box-containing protein
MPFVPAWIRSIVGRPPKVARAAAPAASDRMPEDSVAHLRVRAAMHLMLLVAVGLLVGKIVESERLERLNQTSIEIVGMVAEQSLLTERINAAGGVVAMGGGEDLTQVLALSDTVALAQAEVRRLDDLLIDHGLVGDDAHTGFRAAYDAWRQTRGEVWLQSQQVVLWANLRDAVALKRAVESLHKEVVIVAVASDWLLQQARAAAIERSQNAVYRARVWTGFTLLFLTIIVLLVTELAARSVRRQYLALAGQAAQLERLALVAEHTTNGVAVHAPDRKVVWVNDAFVRLHGYRFDELLGQEPGRLLRAMTVNPVLGKRIMAELRAGRGISNEMRVINKDGTMAWVDVDTQPYRDRGGKLAGWISVHTDITESRNQQQMLTLALDGAALGSWSLDMVTGQLACNDRVFEIVGLARSESLLNIQAWWGIVHPDEVPGWRKAVGAHLKDQSKPLQQEIRLKHGDGRYIWVLFRGTVVQRDSQGWALRMAGICMDINAQKALETQLRDNARTDELTRMPNRAVVLERVGQLLARTRATPGYHFAVMFMDFDRFKQVNDTLGHGAGDDLLRQVAERLEQSLRPSDSFTQSSDYAQMAARMGGDEFVVVLDDIRGDLDAEIVAARLVEVLGEPYQLGAHTVTSSVSIGIVTSALTGNDVDTVLRDADIAMYEAKRAGRGRYVMFEPSMHKRASDGAALENDLRQALARAELFVVYQPVVDLRTGRVAGLEALVRWQHPQRGLVSPIEFIAVAETVGLIGPIGLFVLRRACAEFAKLGALLGEQAPLAVAVNLSRAQLRHDGMVDDVLSVLREYNLHPSQLILEVTESLAAQDQIVQASLHGIRALGVALALDDFGTGYSSLSCLHELPVNTVKIDRTFVAQAQGSDYHRVLIEATIRMAQALGLGTVAEGIETTGQADLMRTLGCDKGQGYLYSKPLSMDALLDWMRSRNAQSS